MMNVKCTTHNKQLNELVNEQRLLKTVFVILNEGDNYKEYEEYYIVCDGV